MNSLWPDFESRSFAYISRPPSAAWRKGGPRRLVILGSTGSIGQNALAVARQCNSRPIGLACGRNIGLLAKQANEWHPDFLACIDAGHAEELRWLLDYSPVIWHGPEGYADIASLDSADCIVSAQVGAAGLRGTLAAARKGKVIALANKESLVLAGDLLRGICAQTGAAILPVDSEHYAIFQCLCGRQSHAVKRLILTASGGPFLGQDSASIAAAAPEQALRHPNWSMGAKISVDSATLMNKGLEFIEALKLYGAQPDQVQILIHPQSIIHSLVEFQDNSQLAQLAVPDMRLPIAGCLGWPYMRHAFIKPLDLADAGSLSFSRPDLDKFPCLRLAMAAACKPPDPELQNQSLRPACIALNAANEIAVEHFLARKCRLGRIPRIIEGTLAYFDAHKAEIAGLCKAGNTQQSIESLDALARRVALAQCAERESLD